MSRAPRPAATVAAREGLDALSAEGREALRALILALADSKRLLGLRYAERMLGAPALEAGIAASSLAQDEWGHARLTYALLADFGDDVRALEHEREPGEYRSLDALDAGFASWSALIAAALLADTALSVQYAALGESRYAALRNRVQKLLDEESFHWQYAAGWTRRLAAAPAPRAELRRAVAWLLPQALRWFGREDEPGGAALLREGMVRAGPDALRAELLARVAPVLAEAGLTGEVGLVAGPDGDWSYAPPLDWAGWQPAARRPVGSQPDAEVIARARGDKNRSLLLD